MLAMEASRTEHFCDMCELDFKTESELIAHEEEHEVCGLEGCKFTANKEVKSSRILITAHNLPQFLFFVAKNGSA